MVAGQSVLLFLHAAVTPTWFVCLKEPTNVLSSYIMLTHLLMTLVSLSVSVNYSFNNQIM